MIAPRRSGAMFNTTGATPIPEQGLVYFQYQVTADWGTLESTGVLVTADGNLRLPAPFRIEGATITGDGWKIVLANGWSLVPAARAGDFAVVASRR